VDVDDTYYTITKQSLLLLHNYPTILILCIVRENSYIRVLYFSERNIRLCILLGSSVKQVPNFSFYPNDVLLPPYALFQYSHASQVSVWLQSFAA
jgi:hypothetical protein